ncbi:zinc ribbon domain-containing protein [Nanoarchaeota archaeon]
MANCKNCESEPYDDDNFCRDCGNELESYSCECGAEIESDDNYCHACGSALEGVVDEGDDDSDGGDEPGPEPSPPQPEPDNGPCCGQEVQQNSW